MKKKKKNAKNIFKVEISRSTIKYGKLPRENHFKKMRKLFTYMKKTVYKIVGLDVK